ncbi:MAG: hypothetical protein ACJ798_05255 [Phenylobacterium sp.]
MRQLAGFNISARETDFLLRLEDETGEAVEFAASPEQLDLMIDALDDLLSEDDDAFEVDEGRSFQKPAD